MHVTTGIISEYGSCNYCWKGKLNSETKRLEYPYKFVISVSGKQASTTFCFDCFHKLQTIKVE